MNEDNILISDLKKSKKVIFFILFLLSIYLIMVASNYYEGTYDINARCFPNNFDYNLSLLDKDDLVLSGCTYYILDEFENSFKISDFDCDQKNNMNRNNCFCKYVFNTAGVSKGKWYDYGINKSTNECFKPFKTYECRCFMDELSEEQFFKYRNWMGDV